MAALIADVETHAGAFRLRVTLDVPGGTTAVVGPSGAGKTLTLRSIAGLARPRSGRIALAGRTVLDTASGINVPPRARRIGYVFQEYALFPHLSVSQNLSYGIAGWPGPDRKRRSAELLDLLHLTGMGDSRPRHLSGGQQQRVALGRALAPRPDLLLLDEPFSALDASVRAELGEQISALSKELGFTTVLVTHDVAEAYRLSDRMVLLDGGTVLQHGPREEVFHRPNSPLAAQLLGFQNLLEGQILAGSGTARVAVADLRFDVPYTEAPPGRPVVIGFRAESARAIPDEGGPLDLVGSVDRGTATRLHLRSAEGALVVADWAWSDSPLPRRWRVSVVDGALQLWSANSEASLRPAARDDRQQRREPGAP